MKLTFNNVHQVRFLRELINDHEEVTADVRYDCGCHIRVHGVHRINNQQDYRLDGYFCDSTCITISGDTPIAIDTEMDRLLSHPSFCSASDFRVFCIRNFGGEMV